MSTPNTTPRPSKAEMFMAMAHVAAKRSSCQRRFAVGCIITDSEMTTVLSMGYNGPAKGVNEPCTLTPDVPGSCTCVHAELNALVKAPYHGAVDLIMFTTLSPCLVCARHILNSAVTMVYYDKLYRDDAGVRLLRSGGVDCKERSLVGTALGDWLGF